MNKTRKQLVRLAQYLIDNLHLPKGLEHNINTNKFTFYADYEVIKIAYYGIKIYLVRDDIFSLELPHHIDIREFNMDILLKDLWIEAVQAVRKRRSSMVDKLRVRKEYPAVFPHEHPMCRNLKTPDSTKLIIKAEFNAFAKAMGMSKQEAKREFKIIKKLFNIK